MSIAIMSRLFKLPLGSCNRKLLALRLADFADDEGRGIWPTVARLASETELSERTVQRTLKDFVDEGLLVVVANASGRPGQATRYDFDLNALERIGAANRNPQPTGDSLSPVKTGDNQAETGDKSDIDGCHGDTRTIIEPSQNPPERERERDVLEKDRRDERLNRKAVERAFKRWYPTWPTYQRDSEDAARKAWCALSDDERACCLDRTPEFIAMVKTQMKNPSFLFASVYLTEKAWERLPPRPAPEARPEVVKPFGKAWQALRLSELCRPMATAWPPAPMTIRQIIERGGEAAERELAARRARYGWPKVYEMHENAAQGKGVVASPQMILLGNDFHQVERGSGLFEAWRRFHERENLPWLPECHGNSWVWFPAISVDMSDLDQAVASAFRGFKQRIEGNVPYAAQ